MQRIPAVLLVAILQMLQGELNTLVDKFVSADIGFCSVFVNGFQQICRYPDGNNLFIRLSWHKYFHFLARLTCFTPCDRIYMYSIFNIKIRIRKILLRREGAVMKKIILVTLVAILLFSTFAGCDALLENLQNLPVPTNPTNPTDPTGAVRTTVTEEEWLAAMDSGNFTVDMAASLGAQSTTQHIEYTESSRYQNQTGTPVNGEFYYTQIDGLTYEIIKEGAGYVAREVAGDLIGAKLGDISNLRDIYSDLVYDETTNSYKCNYTDDYNQTFDFAFYFNNGSIQTVKMTVTRSDSLVITYDFYDFGTTTIELPEYTMAPDDEAADSVRNTVTEEEWRIAMESDNYTVDAVASLGEQSATQHMALTEASRYHYSQQNGREDEAYYAKINGTAYCIRKGDAGYVARKDSSDLVGMKFGDISDTDLREVYSNLAYDEEAKIYKYNYTDRNNQEFEFTFCFENGSIKTAKIVATTSASVVVTYDVHSFGTTTIELPEYTMAS